MKAEDMARECVMGHAKKAIQEQIPYFEFAEQMFLAGFKACAKERLNATTISDYPIKDEYALPKDILGLWEQTVCEIRAEIKAQETPALVYAKELCDKLEHSMCAIAGGPYDLQYSIGD